MKYRVIKHKQTNMYYINIYKNNISINLSMLEWYTFAMYETTIIIHTYNKQTYNKHFRYHGPFKDDNLIGMKNIIFHFIKILKLIDEEGNVNESEM